MSELLTIRFFLGVISVGYGIYLLLTGIFMHSNQILKNSRIAQKHIQNGYVFTNLKLFIKWKRAYKLTFAFLFFVIAYISLFGTIRPPIYLPILGKVLEIRFYKETLFLKCTKKQEGDVA